MIFSYTVNWKPGVPVLETYLGDLGEVKIWGGGSLSLNLEPAGSIRHGWLAS